MSRPLITAVGSFPLGSGTPEESLRYYVELQLKLGFGLITDGEPRHDMISYLVGDIPGLGFVRGKAAVVGRIAEPRNLRECLKVKDLNLVRNLLSERASNKPVKIAVTGPVTLGFTCALGGSGPYSGPVDPSLYDDLAFSLGSLASYLQSSGAVVQIDEPGLSGGFINPTKGVNYLRRMTSGLDPNRTVVHVCGRISRRLNEELLKLGDVDVLSHAFASSPENLDVLDRERFLEAGKSLGAGIARVGIAEPEKADSPEEIAALLRSVQRRIGEEVVRYVHPDCGLRSTNTDAATTLLTNLSRAVGASTD